jgi:hypothetical protein
MNSDVAAQKAFDRLAKVGFEQLTETEKVLATVWTFAAEVANHGFVKYFSRAAGNTAFHAPAALTAIGAPGLAEIAAKANAVFGDGGPPADRDVRLGLVRALDDKARKSLETLETRYFESPEDVDELLEAYLNRK